MSRILYIQYSNPAAYPSLEHSSHRLADEGWDVLFLESGAMGVETLRFASSERIAFHRMAYAAGGWRQKLCYAAFCVQALRRFLLWRPDWVYLSDPLVCPIGLFLSFWPGSKVVYHEHDSPHKDSAGLFMQFVLWTRQRLGPRAEIAILPNPARVELFKRETHADQTVFCVPNFPTKEEIGSSRPASDNTEVWLLYHGSLVPSRLPLLLLDALVLTPPALKLLIVYETIGHQGYMRHFQDQASKMGLGGRVKSLGAVPTREELLSHARRCDIGLALMPKQSDDVNMKFMAGASNKPFDYLACGLALVVSTIPDWEQMFVAAGYGLACDPGDPQSIAKALSWFVAHPKEMRAMGEKGRQRLLTEWNYERAFQPVLNRLKGETS